MDQSEQSRGIQYWKDQLEIASKQLSECEGFNDRLKRVVDEYIDSYGDTKKYFYYVLERMYLQGYIAIKRAESNEQPIEFRILKEGGCKHHFDQLFLKDYEVILQAKTKGPGSACSFKSSADHRWRDTLNWFLVLHPEHIRDIDAVVYQYINGRIESNDYNRRLSHYLTIPYPSCFTNKDYIFKLVNTDGTNMRDIGKIDVREYYGELWNIQNLRPSQANHKRTIDVSAGGGGASKKSMQNTYTESEQTSLALDHTGGSMSKKNYWKECISMEDILLTQSGKYVPRTKVDLLSYTMRIRETKTYFYYILERLYQEGHIDIKRAITNQPIEFTIIHPEVCLHQFDLLFIKDYEFIVTRQLTGVGSLKYFKNSLDEKWRDTLNWFIVDKTNIQSIDKITGNDISRQLTRDENLTVSEFLCIPYPDCFSNTSYTFKYINTTGKNMGKCKKIDNKVYRAKLKSIYEFNSAPRGSIAEDASLHEFNSTTIGESSIAEDEEDAPQHPLSETDDMISESVLLELLGGGPSHEPLTGLYAGHTHP